MKPEVQKILQEIFNPFIQAEDLKSHDLWRSPDFSDLENFALLLLEDKSEESFQKFLGDKSNFLFRQSFSTDESPLGIIAKPPLSNFNFADFAIFSVSQGGPHIHLIELERPNDRLFTKKMTPAHKLQTALGQIYDWKEWLQSNQVTFINSCFKILKDAPKYPVKKENGTFIYCDKNKLNNIWNAFGGTEFCTIDYLIVLGRWGNLDEKERSRLILYNKNNASQFIKIRTYEGFIRKALDGPRNLW